ncbi:hypothetical protein FRC11_000540, partial [Ceratobasidium sp. 423]
MRGTKSAFNYARPQIPAQIQSPPQPSQDQLIQISRNGGQQVPSAREKQLREQKEALDAMGMRRGRPDASPSPVPHPSHAQQSSSHQPAPNSPLPSHQPLTPLTRSRPSKSGSDKAKSRQPTLDVPPSPRKSVPSTPRGATPTTPRVAPSTPSTPRATKPPASPSTQKGPSAHRDPSASTHRDPSASTHAPLSTHTQKPPSTPSTQRINTNLPGRTGPVSPRKSTAPLVPASPRKSTGKPPVGGVKLPGVGSAVRPSGTASGVKATTTGSGVKPTTTGGGGGSGVKPIATGSGVKPMGTGSGIKPTGTGSGIRPTGTGSGVRPTVTGSGVKPTGTGSGLRPTGTGTNGVKGLNTGGKNTLKSPTADFFNDPSWKHTDPAEKEKDIWGGEGVPGVSAAGKFDGFADSFDVGGKARPMSQLGAVGGGHHAAGGHHQATSSHHQTPSSHHQTPSSHHQTPSSHSHHQPTTSTSLSPPALQQPKSRTPATRDAFEGLGIPNAPSPALSLRELAARSPNPSPGIPAAHGPSPVPYSRSHPLATGATAGTIGTLTTHATAGSTASGSKGGTGAKANAMALSAEERFPSIEDLDAAGVWGSAPAQPPKLPPRPRETRETTAHMTGPNSFGLKPPVQGSGARSQQVT